MRRAAFLFPLALERAPLARLCKSRSPGLPDLAPYRPVTAVVGDREVLLVVTGVGTRRAAGAAAAVLDSWRPDLLLVAGLAGALEASLPVSAIVSADAVCTETESLLPDVILDLPEGLVGTILTLDRILVTEEQKRGALHIGGRLPVAVDMESAAVAREAVSRGVAWGAVRAISDRAADSLPLDLNAARTGEGDLSVGRIARAVCLHPRAVPGMMRLTRDAHVAATGLARALFGWLRVGGG